MGEYSDSDVLNAYAHETENQIVELNRTIVALRSKISLLERELQERDKIPIPKPVLKQFVELEAKVRKLEGDIKYYKKYVPINVIINRENKEKPTRSGGIPK